MQEVVTIPRFQKRKSEILFLLIGGFLTGYSLVFPERTAESIRGSAVLFITAVFPSLFAFSVAAKLLGASGFFRNRFLARIGSFFGISDGAFSAFLLGMTGGFPTGTAVLADFVRSGTITKEEAERILPFVNMAGPAFLVGTVGNACFHREKIGISLLLAQSFSAFLCLAATMPKGEKREEPQKKTGELSFAKGMLHALSDSLFGMLTVFSCIVFFSLLSDAVSCVFPIGEMGGTVFSSALEIASGLFRIADLPLSPVWQLLFCAVSVGCGGLCVFFQVLSECEKGNFSAKRYAVGRLLFTAFFVPLTLLFWQAKGEKAYFFLILAVFTLIFLLRVAKNRRIFPKGVEKKGGLLYNKDENVCPKRRCHEENGEKRNRQGLRVL